MRRTRFDDWPCPIARVVDLIGDWWTPIILRDACGGTRRFDHFQKSLDIPKAVLAARLTRLCDEALMEKIAYQDNPVRYEYRLTDKGRDFWPVLAAMWRWGEDWMWPEGQAPPLVLKDRATGNVVRPLVVDEATGSAVTLSTVRVGRNPSQRV